MSRLAVLLALFFARCYGAEFDFFNGVNCTGTPIEKDAAGTCFTMSTTTPNGDSGTMSFEYMCDTATGNIKYFSDKDCKGEVTMVYDFVAGCNNINGTTMSVMPKCSRRLRADRFSVA